MSTIAGNAAVSQPEPSSREQAIREAAAMPQEAVARLTVDQYHRMIESGVLQPGDPIELLEGFLVPKMPNNPRHMGMVMVVAEVLMARVPDGWCVRVQGPITTESSEPEPDLVVARGRSRDYLGRHPALADTALLVEVADVSLRRDRGWKMRVYAKTGFPVYWIVNVADGQLEVYSDPSGDESATGLVEYRQKATLGTSAEVPFIIEGQEVCRIPVAELLP